MKRILQMRRLQFYLRNGIKDTGITTRLFGVEFKILECVLTEAHSGEQVKEIYEKRHHLIRDTR